MRVIVALCLLAGCIRTDTVQCEDGSLCPAGTRCVELSSFGGQIRCTTDDELEACEGKTQLEGCDGPMESPTKRCYDGACIDTGCGNAILDPSETCDDGNQVDEPVGAPGACSSDCSSRLTCGDGIVDLHIGETCDDATGIGGYGPDVARDGCTACRLDELEWIAEPHEPGPIEEIAVMAYDAHRDRTVMLAQTEQEIRSGVGTLVWSTWEWDGVRWTRQTPRVQPFPAAGMAMAYDHARRRVVVFGGTLLANQHTNAEWEWDGAHWVELQPVSRPSARSGAAMAYDARRQRIVLVGGEAGGGNLFDDVWARNAQGEWEQLAGPTGFMGRYDAAAAYDPARDVVVVFGGRSFGGQILADTWELSASGWAKIEASGPAPRTRARMAYDAVAGEVVLYAGIDNNEVQSHETWRWNGTRWMQIGSTPVGAEATVVAMGPTRAGLLAVHDLATELLPAGATAWTRVRTGTARPIPGTDWAAAVDVGTGRIMLVGAGTPNADVWLWSGSDWSRLNTLATQPTTRSGASLVFDPVAREFLLFGGQFFPAAGAPSFRNDTWAFDETSTWRALSTPTAPSGRMWATMSYDATDGAVVLFGGHPVNSETWRLVGNAWQQASPAVAPPPTYGAVACTAAPGDGVLVFGGSSLDTRVWRWREGTWTMEDGVGAARTYAVGAFDAARGQFVVHGGRSSTSITFDETDEWRDGTWTAAPNGYRTAQHVMVPALDGHGVIEMMGVGRPFAMRQLRTRVSAVPESCGPNDDDGDTLVGCDDPDCWQVCTPYCPPGSDRDAAVCAIGCGDGTCNLRESCRTCPGDCGPCPARCGDFTCDASESSSTCPGDCP